MKRVFALFLCLAMCLSMFPVGAFAQEDVFSTESENASEEVILTDAAPAEVTAVISEEPPTAEAAEEFQPEEAPTDEAQDLPSGAELPFDEEPEIEILSDVVFDDFEPEIEEPVYGIIAPKTELVVGETMQLSLSEDIDGSTAVWSSSDETVLTVDETGLVTANNVGVAVINADVTENEGETVTYSLELSVVEEYVSDYVFAGIGTEEEPFEVGSEEELRLLSELVNAGDEAYTGACYLLTADISLTSAWTPIGTPEHPFTGSFNGSGMKLTGLTCGGETYFGLFGVTENAALSLIAIENADVHATGFESVGAIVGYMQGGRITESYVTGNVSSNTGITGGLVGVLNGGTIENCYNTSEVNGYEIAGGVAGSAVNGAVINCCYGSGWTDTAVWKKQVGYVVGYVDSSNVINSYAINGADYHGYIIRDDAVYCESCYAGFDFSSVWTLNGSAPQLDNNVCNATNSFSLKTSVTTERQYRALLIGQQSYNFLNRTIPGKATVGFMRNALQNSTDDWEITCAYDVSNKKSGETSAFEDCVRATFSGSTSNDINLFYSVSHGESGDNLSSSILGSIECFDLSTIKTSQLAYLLNSFDGHFYVILDCCGSGGIIATDENAQSSNNELISAFTELDVRSVNLNSGEMRTSKFSVLTACSYYENAEYFFSDEDKINGCSWFTKYLLDATGFPISCAPNTGTVQFVLSSMPADTNNNHMLSFSEAYAYTYEKILDKSKTHVQIYPSDCSDVLFNFSGKGGCGINCNWIKQIDGTIELFGTGEMDSYSGGNATPWASNSDEIKKVVINSGITNVGDCAFSGCINLTDVNLPDSILTIGKSAFNGCKLKNIIIPSSIESIGDIAFNGCNNLESIVLPYSLNSIGYYSFNKCTVLKSVVIENSKIKIGNKAFSDCTELEDIYYAGSEEEWKTINDVGLGIDSESVVIHYNVLRDSGACGDNLKWKLEYDGTLTISGTGEMYDYYINSPGWYKHQSSYTALVIDSGVTSIGRSAFLDSPELKNIYISATVKKIGDDAFKDCKAITDVYYDGNELEFSQILGSGNDSLKNAKNKHFGSSVDYESFPCSATITVRVVTSVMSLPYNNKDVNTSEYIHDAEAGRTFTVSEICKNSIGEYWYKIGEGLFIYAGDVTTSQNDPTLKIEKYEPLPETVVHGKSFDLEGIISSNVNIDSVKAYIIRNNTEVKKASAAPNKKEYNLNEGIDAALKFAELDVGEYIYKVEATAKQYYSDDGETLLTASKQITLINQPFSVVEPTTTDTYTVTYNANGGSGAPDQQTKEKGKRLQLSLVEPERKDYIFLGWATDKDASEADYQPGANYDKDEDLTLYAVWSEIPKFKITSPLTYTFISRSKPCVVCWERYVGADGYMIHAVRGHYLPDGAGFEADQEIMKNTWTSELSYPVSTEGDLCVIKIWVAAMNGDEVLASDIIYVTTADVPEITVGGSNVVSEASVQLTMTIDKNNGLEITDSGFYVGHVNDKSSMTKYSFLKYSTDQGATGAIHEKTVTMTLTGLETNKKYYYMAYAENTYGEAVSESRTFVLGSAEEPDSCGDSLKWKLDENGTLTISGSGDMYDYTSSSSMPWSRYSVKEIVIGSRVTSIGDYAFYGCDYLESVTIGSRVTSIGDYAFYGCDYLESVTIGSRVTSIGDYAFGYCNNLDEINIPGKVKGIGKGAFSNCKSLTEIKIPDSVTTVGSDAFQNCTSLKKLVLPFVGQSRNASGNASRFTWIFNSYNNYGSNAPSSLKTVEITDMDHIPDSAFIRCSSLTKVILPDEITSIGASAFEDCSSLKSVNIPDGVTSIGASAFEDCSSLTGIDIPYGVKSIGEKAFFYCSGITVLNIPDSVTSIYYNSFAGCTGLKSVSTGNGVTDLDGFYFPEAIESVTIGNSVTLIDNYDFRDCAKLSYVIIGSSVETIGSSAFSGCTGLGSIEIPDSVTNIEDYAFEGCTALTDLSLGSGLISIESYAFNNCSSLADIEIPDSVTDIGEQVFSNCTGLTSVKLGNGVKSIERSAFSGCTALTGIDLPDSLTSIGSYTFENCASLSNISLGNGLKDIGYKAFNGCSSLASIVIPESMTAIGSSAFEGCTGLVNVTIPESVTAIGDSAFEGCTGLVSAHIPDSVTYIDDDAFYGCTSLTNVTIPDSVTYIDDDAFYGCTALTSVTIGRGTKSIGNRAFAYCDSLTSISVAPENRYYCSIDGVLFNIIATELVAFPGGYAASYVIPERVTCIGRYAFFGSSIVSVTISDSVVSIEYSAFENCDRLTSVSIGHSMAEIRSGAFDGCSSLADVYYSGSEDKWNLIEIYNSNNENDSLINARKHFDIAPMKWSWSLDDDGTLTISGTGDMNNYSYHLYAPWDSSKEAIKKVIIEPGITGIGSYAFYGCYYVTGVEIPESVTSIGEEAFESCGKLKSLEIPDSVTYIGEKAFEDCGIVTATIGSGVTLIGRSAFSGCDNLVSIDVSPENPRYSSIDGVVFNKAATELVAFPGGYVSEPGWYISSYIIPDGVTNVAEYAFADCRLENLTIPESMTQIGEYAFARCLMENVTIPDSVTSIGESAFSYCYWLKEVTVPDSVKSIGEGAFEYCYDITGITIGSGVEHIGSYAFSGCRCLTSLEIPKNATEIEIYAFSGCDNLTSVTFAEGTTRIGDYALAGCKNLNNVIIPVSVMSIGIHAFDYGNAISDIYYYGSEEQWKLINMDNRNDISNAEIHYNYDPSDYSLVVASGECGEDLTWTLNDKGKLIISGTGSMSDYSWLSSVPWYQNRSSVLNVEIKAGVTSIGGYAFYDCSSLTSVDIPDGITSIGKHAFYSCSSLTGIDIKDGVSVICDYAFGWCSSLTEVKIPDSVTSIGKEAFSGCDSLISASVGSGASSIGDGAFSYCGSLTSVNVDPANEQYCSVDGILFNKSLTELITFAPGYGASYSVPDSVTSIRASAFYGCSSLTDVTLPSSLISIGDSAFQYCYSLVSIIIPENVTSIGNQAFGNCSKLKSILVDSDNKHYSSVDGVLFDHAATELILFPSGYANSYIIPDGVTTIGEEAFDGCYNLTSVKIPDSVTNIGDNAFVSCGLTGIIIPDSVTSIGEYAFSYCRNLINVTVGSGVSDIASAAFWQCAKLKYVFYCGSETDWNKINIDSGNDCLYLANIIHNYDPETFDPAEYETVVESGTCGDNVSWTLGDGGTLIISGTGAMEDYMSYAPWYNNNSSIVSVFIKPGVTRIGSYAFMGCGNLIQVTVPDTVASIGNGAFMSCYNLTEINIPKNVAEIEIQAFYYCSKLNSITVDSSNEAYCSIDGVLYNKDASELTAFPGGRSSGYAIPDGVTSIAYCAFAGSYNLTDISIPESVSEIGERAFSGCSKLKSITVDPANKHFSSIDGVLFNKTATLLIIFPAGLSGSYTIPDTVKALENYCFYSSYSLINVIIPESVTEIGNYAFASCTSLTDISIPLGVTSIGMYTFYNCRALEKVTIPSAVTTIGNGAFSDCTSLSDIYYTGSQAQWDSVTIAAQNEPLENAKLHCDGLSYTVKYTAAEGTGAPTAQKKLPGEPITLSSVVPVREGYTFLGWATENGSRTVEYHAGDAYTVDADITLYAVWKLPGDINGDGLVGTKDFVTLMRYVAGDTTVSYDPNALDVSNDEVVDTRDFVLLMQYVAGADVKIY